MTDTLQKYIELANTGSYDPKIGSALITMVEPHVGHEHGYNRWYEDDHFYSGAMAMPWMFTGRRWVAPKPYQALRFPADSRIAKPLDQGKYISIYWINAGQHENHMAWTGAINQRLDKDDRVFKERTHVFTSFQTYLGANYRDKTGPRDIHALDYPYRGLVVEVIDAPDEATRTRLLEWLRGNFVPAALEGSKTAMCLYFEPLPLLGPKALAPQASPTTPNARNIKPVEGVGTRLTLLWFTEDDPAEDWATRFGGHDAALKASGLGKVELAAPFIPTLPGTDRYVDELR